MYISDDQMQIESLLITGGAGFVGSNLAVLFRERRPHVKVTAFDNLHRRGSELNLPRLRDSGVTFVHGDVRNAEDFSRLPAFDLLIDCSAEPSVHAGSSGSPREVLNINLLGTINCLEAARTTGARFLFLSTSRVYPIAGLNEIPWIEEPGRFRWATNQQKTGVSELGIREDFPLTGPRSFYGASKLASELLIQEYNHTCGLPALINRCGILTGPWQMGKVDQGVVTLWVARHHFERPLQYTGFGGTGKQVRDLLHIQDLFELLLCQLDSPPAWDGRIYNVGGGPDVSVSLRELTDHCRSVTKREVPIAGRDETNPLDVRIYVTDARRAARDFNWRPKHDVEDIIRDIHNWICTHESDLAPLLA
jgi:CDP-paratose 2-epimerase